MLTNRVEPRTYYDIAVKANSYHVNYYLRVLSRYDAFFTAANAAPALLAPQLLCFRNAITAEDEFFKISTKSDLTPQIQEWDTKRDNNTSSIRAMAQAYALNPGDAQKQADWLTTLKKDLLKSHKDIANLILCPTEYAKARSKPGEDGALSIFGHSLDPSYKIFWTGDQVMSHVTKSTLEYVASVVPS